MAGVSVADLFEGALVQTIRCAVCHTESPTHEAFCDLSLAVRDHTPTNIAVALDQLTAVEQYGPSHNPCNA
jgi:ubiquitin C-terminal hydrolase